MSGLLFLTSDEFHIANGAKGPILCNNIDGFSMILFYSKRCEWCKDLIPIFKSLPGKIGGCRFGMINVNNNKKCIIQSRQTVDPITVVPYIVLYVNGKPYMKYTGPHNEKDIIDFIVEIASNINKKGATITQKEQQEKQDKQPKNEQTCKIPDFTIGVPKCDGPGGTCYISFEEAYN